MVFNQIGICFFFPALAADPPREPLVNDSMTVQEGTTLHLHCSTQGSPAPTLTWLKDGELVGTITADELSVLEISEITPQGDGQYRCLAENEHGRASSSFNITVECECLSILVHLKSEQPLNSSLSPPTQTLRSSWTSPSARW